MNQKEVKLSVKDLKISFRTDRGKVQAVRDISFDLYKGETLALVGESGSGKSVTNRAIMGILAGNAIKEGGEIIYDGQDLFKIPEEGFHKLRGDKIAMIFQDPMSSLNPIMRVGKQLTEAMLIKGKISQRESRKDFNAMLSLLNKCMDGARGADNAEIIAENKKKCADFNKFEYKHLELENAYNKAKEAADDALAEIGDVLFRIEKNALKDVRRDVAEIVRISGEAYEQYVVCARADELKNILEEIKKCIKVPFLEQCTTFVRRLFGRAEKTADEQVDWASVSEKLEKVREILSEAVAFTEPNFFAMGYYLMFSPEPLPDLSVAELNKFLRKYLDDNFMLDFIANAKQGIIYSNKLSIERKKQAIKIIDEQISVFYNTDCNKADISKAVQVLIQGVENAIDKLEIVKDNSLYTFKSSLKAAVGLYLNATDKEEARQGILALINRVRENLDKKIAENDAIDFDKTTVGMIDYLKAKASGVVYKVTRRMAKTRALKLLEEVGIPEPRRRYKQYPFEFSGGMRQRIVIAIALSANPDILICDEPTTALDVTIQSQILELINKVKRERELSVIFITHDLGVVANMADRVAVMYAGKIVEIGTAEDVFYAPAHPYTWALLSSMPDLDTKEKLEAIPGTPPDMIFPPKGDAFAERNKYAMQIDFEEQPPMFRISDTHYAATWLLHPDAPKVEPPKAVTERIERMKKAGGVKL